MKRVAIKRDPRKARVWERRSRAAQSARRTAGESAVAHPPAGQSYSTLRPVSLKKARADREYEPLRRDTLKRNGACWFARNAGLGAPPCWGGLEVHHRLSRARGGKHEPENLVVLCEGGHSWVHHTVEGRRLGEELGLLLRRGT